METIESIAESLGNNEEKESKEATTSAELLDKLSVDASESDGDATVVVPAPAEEEKPKAGEEKPKTEAKAEDSSSADKS